MERIFQSGQIDAHLKAAKEKVLCWLRCGVTPRQLAFTLALGFAIGCIPLLGITTGICAVLALVLRLNMPAIQAANWIAMPLQLLLLYPFLRLGQWLVPGHAVVLNRAELLTHIEAAPWNCLVQMSSMFGLAVLAWLVTAGPALLVLMLVLTPLMTRASRLFASQAD